MVRLSPLASVDVAQFAERFLHRMLGLDPSRVVVNEGLLQYEGVLRCGRFADVARLVLATSTVGIDREFAQSPDAEKSIQKI